MSIVSQSNRDFNKAINTALNCNVKVLLEINYPNHFYKGRLLGFETQTQGIVLANAIDEKHNKFDQIIIHGNKWISFVTMGEPFPIEKLAARLRKVVPADQVEVVNENTIQILGGKVTVTDKGVEGRGPTTERIRKIYDMFMVDWKN